MEKLSDFLLNMDLSVTPDGLPVLSTEEEQDVLDQLGVREKPDEAQGALELIMAKMKTVREFSLATGDAALEAENDEEFADYGTVIIKTKSGKSTEGTLRVKKGDERFGSIIFRGGDIEAADLPADAFSTMRVIETAGGDDSKPLWASGGSQSDSSSHSEKFLWRAPEDWEVNIIALERGEWAQDMPEEAFRKYKKERPKLGGIFRGQSHFFSQDQIPLTSASSPSLQTGDTKQSAHTRLPSLNSSTPQLNSLTSSAPSSPRGSMKTSATSADKKEDAKENAPKSDKVVKEKKDKDKTKTGKKSKASEKKEEKKEKEAGKERERDAKASSSTGTDRPKTERKWAVFKRSTENRQRLADS